MPITLGGLALRDLPLSLLAALEGPSPVRDVPEFPGRGREASWACPPHTALPPVRPGTLVWPTGATRWAHAYLFVTSDELRQVRNRYAARPGEPLLLVLDDDGHKVQTPLY